MLCFSVSMAVPFVQDWDLVQTLGEGAYGEYDPSFIPFYCRNAFQSFDILIARWVRLI